MAPGNSGSNCSSVTYYFCDLGKVCDLSDFSFLMVLSQCKPPGTLWKPLLQERRMLGNLLLAFLSPQGYDISAQLLFSSGSWFRFCGRKQTFLFFHIMHLELGRGQMAWVHIPSPSSAPCAHVTSSYWSRASGRDACHPGVKAFNLQGPIHALFLLLLEADSNKVLKWLFSNLYRHQNPLDSWLKQIASPYAQHFWSSWPREGPGRSISNKSPSERLMPLVWGPHLRKHCQKMAELQHGKSLGMWVTFGGWTEQPCQWGTPTCNY